MGRSIPRWNLSPHEQVKSPKDLLFLFDGRPMSNDRSQNTRPSSQDADDAISRSIKRVYDQIADEPIPDSLKSLLDRLKQEGPRG